MTSLCPPDLLSAFGEAAAEALLLIFEAEMTVEQEEATESVSDPPWACPEESSTKTICLEAPPCWNMWYPEAVTEFAPALVERVDLVRFLKK